jgi:methanogenic corrinoid protein MtbC1
MASKINKNFDFLRLIDSVVTKDIEKTVEIIKEGIQKNIKPEAIVTKGLQPAMVIVGDKFSTGEYT